MLPRRLHAMRMFSLSKGIICKCVQPLFSLVGSLYFFFSFPYTLPQCLERWSQPRPQSILYASRIQSQNTISVCNFQSMKSPVELNNLLPKFFCYITWFVITWLDPTLDDFQTKPLRQILLFRRNNSFSALKITN